MFNKADCVDSKWSEYQGIVKAGWFRYGFLLILALTLCVFFFWPVFVISVSGTGLNGVLVYPARQEENITMRYLQSTDGQPVEDEFSPDLQNLSLNLVTVRTSNGVNGLYHDPGYGVKREDGVFLISGMDRRYTSLRIRLGFASEHTIILHGGELIRLNNLGTPGDLVVIKIERLTRVKELWLRTEGVHALCRASQ